MALKGICFKILFLIILWALNCRWHIVTVTIDADLGEVNCYLNGNFDGYQTGLPLSVVKAPSPKCT